MQDNHDNRGKSAARPRLARTRFVGVNSTQRTTGVLPTTGDLSAGQANESAGGPAENTQKRALLTGKQAARPRQAEAPGGDGHASVADRSIAHLMQLSGMMRPLRKQGNTLPLSLSEVEEDGYWPLGIQQAGPLPILNVYGRDPFGGTLPTSVSLVMPGSAQQAMAQQTPLWKRVVGSLIFKISLGLLLGLGLLFLASFFVDLPQMLQILGTHLATPQGIGLGVLAGAVYLAGNVLRGSRWKLFLNPVGKVSTLKVIQLYQVAAFLNFLLPIRAGEAAKSLALKRIAAIPISKSLPTVAMDKALDLAPALVIMALAPLLGLHMDLPLWLALGLGSGVLFCLLLLIGLTAWKRAWAINLLQMVFAWLPRTIGNRVEGFSSGFADALLAGVCRPAIFLPALLLTGLVVVCDGLFVMLAFWTIGFSIPFGTALFGYAICRLFSILPALPGQLGSKEAVGLLIFAGLLHLPGTEVAAMYVFSHPWTALIITATGLACLAALGLTISSATRIQNEK